MKRAENKSHCPLNFALETFGDSWSLLIIRDIVYWGKNTYGEFLDSDEGIATNVLASRLVMLEQKDILIKQPHPTDKRKEVYVLTDKGLDLIPVMLEISGWGTHYDPQTAAPKEFVEYAYGHRYEVFDLAKKTVKNGGSLFAGSDSVYAQLKQQAAF